MSIREGLPHTLARGGLRIRRLLRRFLYSQLAMRSALMIAFGKEEPLVRFTVEDDPPSVYMVWRIRADRVEGAPGEFGLPDGIRLAPLRCIEGDAPEYLLTLNVYRVSGLTNALRAEWSVYIADPSDGVPRYMVLDGRSSTGSLDPIVIFVKSTTVEYTRKGNQLAWRIDDGRGANTVRFDIPEDIERVRVHPDFVTANDLIHWTNGVADTTYYNGTMADSPVIPIDIASIELRDESPWARLTDGPPIHVFVCPTRLDIVLSPWSNLDRMQA
jgi:hypothetical protein